MVSKPLNQYPNQPSHSNTTTSAPTFGFRAIKPLLREHQDFLECLVDKLSSADHALCGNALQLINALLRDSIVNGSEEDWPRFLRRFQELGIVNGVEVLMRGDSIGDIAGPVMQFQSLYRLLLRRWRGVVVDMERVEHRKALTRCYTASFPPGFRRRASSKVEKRLLLKGGLDEVQSSSDRSDMWERLGFSSEQPADDFRDAGFLGLMDIMAYIRRDTDGYQKMLLEQGVQPADRRCPFAQASLRVTMMLYQHYAVDHQSEHTSSSGLAIHSINVSAHLGSTIQPLLLRWDRVHAVALSAFLRLWTAAGATVAEFDKIDDLVRILVSRVLGEAGRKVGVEDVEERMKQASLAEIRKWQLEDLDGAFERGWGDDLR